MLTKSFYFLKFLLKTYKISLSAINLYSFFLMSFIFPFIPLSSIGPNNVSDFSFTFSVCAISSPDVQFSALTLCFFSSVSMIFIGKQTTKDRGNYAFVYSRYVHFPPFWHKKFEWGRFKHLKISAKTVSWENKFDNFLTQVFRITQLRKFSSGFLAVIFLAELFSRVELRIVLRIFKVLWRQG